MTICSCCSFYNIQLALIFPLHKFLSKNAGTVLVNVPESVTMLIIPPKILQVTMPTSVVEKSYATNALENGKRYFTFTSSEPITRLLPSTAQSLAPQEKILRHGPSQRITHLMICLPNTCQEEVIQMQSCLRFPVGTLSI